jgi:hypothetical protein
MGNMAHVITVKKCAISGCEPEGDKWLMTRAE